MSSSTQDSTQATPQTPSGAVPPGTIITEDARRTSRVLRSLLHNPMGVIGGIVVILIILMAILSPVLSPYDPSEVHFETPFQRPFTVGFLFGTDDLGRDILSRIMHGTAASLEVGGLAVALAIVVGVPLGLLAGYWGWLDAILSRFTDLMLAFPFLILAVGLTAINGPSLANAAVAIGIAHVPTMIRVVRAETLRLKGSDYVLASKLMDAGSHRILGQHILPNTISVIIVQATVIMPTAVIAEATLSFLGLGIQPPSPSLGIMLSDAQQYLFRAPSAAIIPGITIGIICLAFNLFGDALRDALDPSSDK